MPNNDIFVVVDEKSLCYLIFCRPGAFLYADVLGRSVDGPDPFNGPIPITNLEVVRPATRDDFKRFRVAVPSGAAIAERRES